MAAVSLSARRALLAALSAALLAHLAAAASDASHVVVLTDENFEALTQAATGATTGDWFVEFYAPWCGHCKNLEPTWEKLASELKGSPVVVAKLDATQHSQTASRFGVRGYPTLKLLHKGQVFDFKGKRTLEDLKDFALGGFKKAESVAVPEPIGTTGLIVNEINEVLRSVRTVAAKHPEAAGLVFSAGLLAGVFVAMFIFLVCIGPGGGHARAATPKAAGDKKTQ